MLFRQTVDEVLRYACRAPSVHNTPPWTWRVYDDGVDLRADFFPGATAQRTRKGVTCSSAAS